MSQIEAITTGGEFKDLLEFDVKRVADGLNIKAKSPVLAKFFESFATDGLDGQKKKASKSWGGLEFWNVAQVPVVPDVSFSDVGGAPMLPQIVVNLSFLRAVKLGEGVDFTIKGVFNKTEVENFMLHSKRAFRDLFVEYLEPVEHRYVLQGKSSL